MEDRHRSFVRRTQGERIWRGIIPSLAAYTVPSNSRAQVTKMIHLVTTIPLSSKHRVSQLSFHPRLQYLAVQSNDRAVEIFRVRTEEEIRKKQARRKRRAREKKREKGQKDPDTEEEENGEEREVDLVELFTPYLIVRSNGKIRSFDFGGENATDTKGNTQVRFEIPSPAFPHLVLDLPCARLECPRGP